jgi:hypothetical protein
MSTVPYVYPICARQDAAFAQQLAADLRQAGVSVWPQVPSSSPGAGIAGAGAVLFLASVGSAASSACSRLLGEAASFGRPVKTVVLDDEGARLASRDPLSFDGRVGRTALLGEVMGWLEELGFPRRAATPAAASARKHVFISYTSSDAPFVRELCSRLKMIDCPFFAYKESERDHWVRLGKELDSRIREAAAVLCVMSPAWTASSYCLEELDLAQRLSIPILLLGLQPVSPVYGLAGQVPIDCGPSRSPDQWFADLQTQLRRRGILA